MKIGYQILPEVYDRWQRAYGKDFTTIILPKLLHSLKSFGVKRSTMLDLACGTGTLAVEMARRKWSVIGVDASGGMLQEARRKADAAGHAIVFLQQDMRSLRLNDTVGLVTCMFDAVNHLGSSRDLLRCFRRVHAVLEEGGYFIFDVNNELSFRTLWRQTQVNDGDGFSVILRNSFDARRRRGVSDVTVFVRKGELYERREEKVHERYFPKDELEDMLRLAGFEVLESEDFNFTNDPTVGAIKTWWVARKLMYGGK